MRVDLIFRRGYKAFEREYADLAIEEASTDHIKQLFMKRLFIKR